MMNSYLTKSFWEDKYVNFETGWDIGYISTPIKSYIDKLKNKEISILIPGAGNAYEAEYLYNSGFKNIHVLDIVEQPLKNLENRIPNFPEDSLIQEDFFNHDGKYELIIEQTFFCALDPGLRLDYAKKMNDLLVTNGRLSGLLFDFPLNHNGPPFGGNISEYQNLFSKFFNIHSLSPCYNSILPRQDREVFIIFEKINIP